MKATMRSPMVLGVSVASLILMASPAPAALTPAQKCAAAKLKATAKKVDSKAKCTVKTKFAAPADQTCLQKAEEKFTTAFAKAEKPGACTAQGDAAAIEAAVDTFVETLVDALQPPAGASKPAQTCAVAKLKAANKKTVAKITCRIKNLSASSAGLLTFCLSQAEDKFDAAFAKAETSGTCATSGDAAGIEATVDTFVGTIAAALVLATPTPTPTRTPGLVGTPTPTLPPITATAAANQTATAAAQTATAAAQTATPTPAMPTPTPTANCPCDGMIFPGPTGDPTWGSSFQTSACSGSPPDAFQLSSVVIQCFGQTGTYRGFLVVADGGGGNFVCRSFTAMISGPYDCGAEPSGNVQSITSAQASACVQSLKAIAAADGVACP